MDANFVTLERWTWAPFGGVEEFAETGPGRAISYLDAGSEICFVAPVQGGADATIYRPDHTRETISSEMTQPTIVNAGDFTVYGDNNASNCKNAGQTRSISIVAGIWRGDPTVDVTLPGGLTGEVLAKGSPAAFPAEPAVVTIERLVMEPGASVALSDGTIVLVYVEDGAVTVTGADNGDIALDALDGTQLIADGMALETSVQAAVIVVTIASAP
ncbi:MAG: hypothetical protein WEC79_02465 [Thermomicrobiales bacterium]